MEHWVQAAVLMAERAPARGGARVAAAVPRPDGYETTTTTAPRGAAAASRRRRFPGVVNEDGVVANEDGVDEGCTTAASLKRLRSSLPEQRKQKRAAITADVDVMAANHVSHVEVVAAAAAALPPPPSSLVGSADVTQALKGFCDTMKALVPGHVAAGTEHLSDAGVRAEVFAGLIDAIQGMSRALNAYQRRAPV